METGSGSVGTTHDIVRTRGKLIGPLTAVVRPRKGKNQVKAYGRPRR